MKKLLSVLIISTLSPSLYAANWGGLSDKQIAEAEKEFGHKGFTDSEIQKLVEKYECAKVSLHAYACPKEDCVKIGIMKEDGKDVYSCPKGVLEENAVGYKQGPFWYFNEEKLLPIADKLGIKYTNGYDPEKDGLITTAPTAPTTTPTTPATEPTKPNVTTTEPITPVKSSTKTGNGIPVMDSYDSEPFSAEVFATKQVEYLAAIWTFIEFKNECRFGSEAKRTWAVYGGLQNGVKSYVEYNKDFKYALESIKLNATKNPQLDALTLQINSLKMINRSLESVFKLNNIRYFYNSTQSFLQTAATNASNDFKKMEAQYQASIDLIQKKASECDSKKVKDCNAYKKISDELVAKLNEYSKSYMSLRLASADMNNKMLAIETSLKSIAASLEGADEVKENIHNLVNKRIDDSMICPASPEKLVDKMNDFAVSVGIEANQKNKDIFFGIWKEIDGFVGQSYGRQIILNRGDRFATQIKKWAVTVVEENNKQIRKLTEQLKKMRVTIGMPAYETLAEAQARMSDYVKNHPEFVQLLKKTGGQGEFYNEWYVAQMKKADGTLYEIDLMTMDGKPSLCDGFTGKGCLRPTE